MENKNSTTGIIVGIIAVLLIGGGIWWAMNRDNDTATNESPAASQQESQNSEQSSSGSIVLVATNTPDLSTLVAAVKAADLVETLQGAGPFTVFAPTNDAFAALPAGTLDSLLKPENAEQLKSILTYHVVPGKVLASQLTDGQQITTVQGGMLTVSITDGMAYLIDARGSKVPVEKADVNAENGVVHIIGGVLLPS
jgi:uncharacterized surface protein with fasciclin (FAS1) repeats